MQIKVSNATPLQLDWLVAQVEGVTFEAVDSFMAYHDEDGIYNYTTNWAQGGPVLSKARISRTIDHSGLWVAYSGFNLNDEKEFMHCDRDERIAGFRCLVESRLGKKVKVPGELA